MRRCTGVVLLLILFSMTLGAQQQSASQAEAQQQRKTGHQASEQQQPSSQQPSEQQPAGQQAPETQPSSAAHQTTPPSETQQPPSGQQPSNNQQPSGEQPASTPEPQIPEPQEPAETPTLPRWELFAGYTYMGVDPFSLGTHKPLHGWETNLTLNAARWLGIVADIGGSYGTKEVPVAVPTPFPPCPPLCPGTTGTFPVSTHLYTYLFGARLPYRRWQRVTPFAEVLYGRAHVSGKIMGTSEIDTKGATAGGLGADFAISPRLAWRVQGDYLRTKFFGLKENNFRLSTGIVLHWTHKKKRRTLTTP